MFGEPETFRAVQHTRELERVLRIPRRTWTTQEADTFAAELTKVLKLPGGTMDLRGIQAMALYEAAAYNGLLGPIGVGMGKTLITLLAAFVMFARRPLLLTRANLIDKTRRDWRELSEHWPIPNFIRIEGYEKLGRVAHAQLLELYQPDLIIGDEIHKLKNLKAAVTRRVKRYMDQYPGTKCVALSGTFTRKSLLEWAHIARWALKGNAPVPGADHHSQVEEWAEALDEKANGENQVKPGALYYFCNAEERQSNDLTGVRKAFARRLTETPGVIATSDNYLGSSLSIQAIETDMRPCTDEAFKELRDKWITPDGWNHADPMTHNRHARELAMGFYYVWDPRPPQDWLEARKDWKKAAREILSNNKRHLDSEVAIIQAVDYGHYPEAKGLLERWRYIKPSFKPNTVPRWLDDSILCRAATWAKENVGIIWCEHVAFAEALALKTGLPYYGQGGLNRLGQPIESHPADLALVASVESNKEGRNLQKWSRNLIVSVQPNGQLNEQLIGRTHRPGQLEDEVSVDVLITCIEHADAFERACRQAEYIQASSGQVQKLCYADISVPSVMSLWGRSGPRWNKQT